MTALWLTSSNSTSSGRIDEFNSSFESVDDEENIFLSAFEPPMLFLQS
jgi:hypothetical protein